MAEPMVLMFDTIQSELDRFDGVLADLLAAHRMILPHDGATAGFDPFDHILRSRGKRLRPALVLLASRVAEANTAHALEVACAVELIHTATLIHDDVIDEAEERRGIPSVHVTYGVPAAIVTGDYYLMEAFAILAHHLTSDCVSSAARTVSRICQAQQLQEHHLHDIDLPEEMYLTIIEGKTASLLALACGLGSSLVPHAPYRAELEAYGTAVGMAFQMIDDLLDYIGTPEELGKPSGSDIHSGVITLPLIEALRDPDESVSRPLSELLRTGRPLRADEAERIISIVGSSWAVERVRSRVRELSNRAVRALDPLPDSAVKRALLELPTSLRERTM